MLFSSLVEGFLLDCRVRNLSENTLAAYENALNFLAKYLKDPQADTVSTSDLRRYSLHLQDRTRFSAGNHPFVDETKEGLSPWTVHHYLRPVRTLFNWATDEGLLSENPAKSLGLPKLPKGRVDRFTAEEIDELLTFSRSVSYRDYTIVFLLLDSGLRRGELVALNVQDVDLASGLVTVQHGKGDKWRQVRVGDSCRKVLWTYLHHHRNPTQENQVAFFLSHRGGRITGNAVGCMFRRQSQTLGFRIYCHKFRHTFATNLAKQVPNAFLVAQALGHSDLNTAMIYVHLAQAEAMDVSPMDAHLEIR
jgi:integrase/recombinase XerD